MAQSSNLPTNPAGLYWDADGANFPSRPRLSTYPSNLNILLIAFAIPDNGSGGTTGAVTLTTPVGAAGTNLNADIVTCRARGQRVMVSCGGAGNYVTLGNQTRADAFITSIKAINVQLGGSGSTMAFDGIDLNIYETQTADGPWMTYIGQQLKGFYGQNFLITSPPGGGTEGQATTDRAALAQMYQGGAIDLINPQYYDGPGQPTLTNIENTMNFWNTAVTVNGSSVTIPFNQMSVGFGIDSTNPNWWVASDAATQYTNLVNAKYTPKGAINWAASVDPTNLFDSTVVPVITNNLSAPTILGTGSMTGISTLNL